MKKNARILIIEDDQIFAETLVNLLKREGFEVECSREGQEAIEKVRQAPFDLVVADVKLPGGFDGLDTLVKIKALRPEKKIAAILITGYADEQTPVRAIKAGVDDYIFKPFELNEFLESIRKCLEGVQLEDRKSHCLVEVDEMRRNLEEYSKKLELEVQNQTNQLTLLFEIAREIASSLRMEEVLPTIVERTADVLLVEICSILLLTDKGDELYIAAAKGLPQDVIESVRIPWGVKISGWVVQNKESLLVEDIESDPRFQKTNTERYYTGSFISVPLIFKGKVIGVMNVNNKSSRRPFDSHDLRLVESIADYSSVAIENARLYSNLQGVYLQIISALTSIIEIKDHYTKGHSDRVTKYAVILAKALGFSAGQIECIRLACQLHDLGKIGIDANVLTKPDELTAEEWDELKRHPVKGVEIIKPLAFLKEVIALVNQHHERYDGLGYPDGRKAEDIELGARVIAVADSFDAMTTDRPYRRAMSFDVAIEELRRCSGTQFDARIVDTFIKVIQENKEFFESIEHEKKQLGL